MKKEKLLKHGKFIEVIGSSAADIGFLAAAVCTDETRYFMNFVYCDENKLIATDGRRMHIVELSESQIEIFGFEIGHFYRVLKITKSRVWLADLPKEKNGIGEFPNWKRILDQAAEKKKIAKFENSNSMLGFSQNIKPVLDNLPEKAPTDYNPNPTKYSLNIAYLKPLPVGRPFNVYVNENNMAIFESEPLTALLMLTECPNYFS